MDLADVTWPAPKGLEWTHALGWDGSVMEWDEEAGCWVVVEVEVEDPR
jgi:hypothetical protein